MGKPISVRTRLSAVNDYVRTKGSLKDVSEKHGISRETLRRWLGESVRNKKNPKSKILEKNLKSRPSVLTKRNLGFDNQQKKWSKLEDDSLIEAVNCGMTVDETSGLLGRTPAAIYTRKHILVTKGKLEERFATPEGIKRTRKIKQEERVMEETPVEMTLLEVSPVETAPVEVAPVETAPVESVKEVREVPDVDMDDITNLSLERLAYVVSKFGVSLSINISEGVTLVKMTKE